MRQIHCTLGIYARNKHYISVRCTLHANIENSVAYPSTRINMVRLALQRVIYTEVTRPSSGSR